MFENESINKNANKIQATPRDINIKLSDNSMEVRILFTLTCLRVND